MQVTSLANISDSIHSAKIFTLDSLPITDGVLDLLFIKNLMSFYFTERCAGVPSTHWSSIINTHLTPSNPGAGIYDAQRALLDHGYDDLATL